MTNRRVSACRAASRATALGHTLANKSSCRGPAYAPSVRATCTRARHARFLRPPPAPFSVWLRRDGTRTRARRQETREAARRSSAELSLNYSVARVRPRVFENAKKFEAVARPSPFFRLTGDAPGGEGDPLAAAASFHYLWPSLGGDIEKCPGMCCYTLLRWLEIPL